MERVKCDIQTLDDFIEIKPEGGIKDNSVYEIKLRYLKAANSNAELHDQTLVVYTKLTPFYCTVEAVRSIVPFEHIPDSKILYQIRDTSKFVEYVTQKTYDQYNVPYNVFNYVKYKTAYDVLLSYYLYVTTAPTKGTMGDVSYESTFKVSDISDLLDSLKDDIKTAYDSLFGYTYTGPASPQVTVKHSYITEIHLTNDNPPYRSYKN